jgi:virulence factor
MRIGVIGPGAIAEKAYLPLLAGHARAELAGVAGRSATAVDSVMSRYRIPFGTTDYRELLDRDLDLVLVHASTDAHFEIVGECLGRGVPTYVDKPLSADLAEAEALTARAEQSGTLLAVGFNRRFAPAYRTARYWIGGPVQWFSCTRSRTDPRATLYADSIHFIDLALSLAEDADADLRLRADGQGNLLAFTGRFTAEDGRGGSVDVHHRGGADFERLELHGDGRSALVAELDRLELRRDGRTQLSPPTPWDSPAHRRGFAALLDHVLDSLKDPERCEVSAARVLPAHRLAAEVRNV